MKYRMWLTLFMIIMPFILFFYFLNSGEFGAWFGNLNGMLKVLFILNILVSLFAYLNAGNYLWTWGEKELNKFLYFMTHFSLLLMLTLTCAYLSIKFKYLFVIGAMAIVPLAYFFQFLRRKHIVFFSDRTETILNILLGRHY